MNQDKPQKSQFWIWTTLWLTTMIDSALIYALFVFIFALIRIDVSIPGALIPLMLAARILSLWLGAYIAVKYVMKKSIIFKRDAAKLALLSIVIPLIVFIIAIALAKNSTQDILNGIVTGAVTLGITYFSVRSLITKHGTE